MGEIIDVKFVALDRVAAEQRRCSYVKTDGRRCMMERFREEKMCRAHANWNSSFSSARGLEYPDDHASLHWYLARMTEVLMGSTVAKERVPAVVEMCKLMVKNMNAYEHNKNKE